MHRQLIDRCRKGDSRAQFRIYELYYKAMYNTALRIVKMSQEAEEIMQESFLTAFEKIGTFRGEVSFGAWLKKIVINRSLDSLRKKKVLFEEIDEEGLPQLQTEDLGEEGDESGGWNAESIRQALDQLPDGYRTILSLYLFEGYDHDEIAGILGIRATTSRTQYSRAKKRLRQLLTNKDHG